jgi:uncharacterized cupin superfamily protein
VELERGIFVVGASEHAWEADPEVGGEMSVLCHTDGLEAGVSRFGEDPGPVVWTVPAREAVFILEGEARIEIEGAPTITLKPGDMASLPADARTTWHLTTPFREFWAHSR